MSNRNPLPCGSKLLRARRNGPRRRAGKARQQFPSCNVHIPHRCEGAVATVAWLSRGVSGMSPPAGCMIRRDTSCNAGSARSDRTGVLELPTGGFYERRLRRRGRRCSLFAMRSGVEAVLYPVFQASHCCTTPARVEISPQMYRLWRSYGARFSQSPSEPSPESPIWRALFRGYRGQRVRSGIGGHPAVPSPISALSVYRHRWRHLLRDLN